MKPEARKFVRERFRAVKTGHWKSCHGSARRLKQCACAEELSAHEWISQKTYKPRNDELTVRGSNRIRIPFHFASEPIKTRHKGDGYYNHRFFMQKNSFHPYRAVLTGDAARRVERIDTKEENQ